MKFLNWIMLDTLPTENKKYLITFLVSLSVALILFIANIIRDNLKRKKERKQKLKAEIHLLCEKLIAYAVHASQRTLEARYYYAMHKANPDEDFDRTNYSKYLNDCENSKLCIILNQAELISKLIELENEVGNSKEIRIIKELMYENGVNMVKSFDGIFNATMTEAQIERIRNIEMDKVDSYVRNETIGKNIICIQKIIYSSVEPN